MEITIPDFDFTFEEVVLHKANEFIKVRLAVNNIAYGFTPGVDTIKSDLSGIYYDLANSNQRLIFIRQIMYHIADSKVKLIESINGSLPNANNLRENMLRGLEVSKNRLDDFQFFLCTLLIRDGYNLDTNAFTIEESFEINSKLDLILYGIDELKVGEEILFDEIQEYESTKEEIRNDLATLKTQTILGKKTYFQLFLGKICSYAGSKAADWVLDSVKPQIIAIFIVQAPHIKELIEKFFLLN